MNIVYIVELLKRGVIFNLRYYVYIYLVDTNDNAIGVVIF